MKHSKLFNNETNYNAWLKSDNYVTPYVSKIKSNGNINYQKRIILPYDKKIEYLEATGSQYINTNIIGNGYYRFKIKFLCNALYSLNDQWSATIFGARINSWTRSFQLSTYNNGCFGYNGDLNSEIGINSINTEYVVELKNDNKLYVNNVEKLTLDNVVSFNTSDSLLLFAVYDEHNIREQFIGKIYYFTLYDENDNIIMDLIPVKKNNIGYMYDKVSKQLFSNQGTGEFILGPDL